LALVLLSMRLQSEPINGHVGRVSATEFQCVDNNVAVLDARVTVQAFSVDGFACLVGKLQRGAFVAVGSAALPVSAYAMTSH